MTVMLCLKPNTFLSIPGLCEYTEIIIFRCRHCTQCFSNIRKYGSKVMHLKSNAKDSTHKYVHSDTYYNVEMLE